MDRVEERDNLVSRSIAPSFHGGRRQVAGGEARSGFQDKMIKGIDGE